MNCLYSLDHGYAFNGNTTAFVEMEDGVNEFGLAIGLTFVYSLDIAPGFNGGMLVRYLLEKCKTVFQAIKFLQTIPIASSQTITLADASGEIAVVECNSKDISIIYPDKKGML
ncbi:C45 family peptidase [Coprobacillaceae bacterium CR2/5/TPMF4]|nr:C45 family peptidase [Coprobacillaceae bacterium CR2/5/TPMF4]